MTTSKIPPSAQLSEAAEYRNDLVQQSMRRLQHFAWRALNVLGKSNGEVAVVCIEVDSRWRPLVDELMPGHDWDTIRAQGTPPIARGIVGWGVCELVADEFPDLATVALAVPENGILKGIVLTEGGCTIYDIVPEQMPGT